MKKKIFKLAFLLSHPIQYFSPLLEKITLHPDIDLTVYYCSLEGAREMIDVEFNEVVKWDIALLNNYKYKRLRNYSLIPSTHKKPLGLVNVGIIWEIFNGKYDAIIIHGWNYVTAWLAYITSILLRNPLFIRGDSSLYFELLKPSWKLLIKKLIFRILFKFVYGFLVVGSSNAKFYSYYGVPKSKMFWTPFAVDNDRFTKKYDELFSKKMETKKQLGIPHKKVVLLFCAKLINRKNPIDVLMAYEKVRYEDKALVFLGEGNLRKQLEEYAKSKGIENVFFTGFINQSQLPYYYLSSDIVVLPSIIEPWGLVVNEAMCFHLPIIVSNHVGCHPDLIKHGENGFVYTSGDTNELTLYLEKLFTQKELREKMGEKSYEIIKEWDYEQDIDGILKALQDCCKAKKK
ncbi:MAG: hypothetical protein A2Y62_10820 [Candidatus Fischerbacteria bacterium RBG_13_37_8]|uniref:Glycosyl transferase family 1 domain-containing protein n=1 Tax=Candidatus Fischerbacteria bacterium RBG_13_37_8 TaxID=1817863 RepID=A0A1F5VUF6_9BACT|nr:MAG: hypothetical protein A2Y62_10820 [Candidatus Fischerbacteria bacterium RBG_13_37_8]